MPAKFLRNKFLKFIINSTPLSVEYLSAAWYCKLFEYQKVFHFDTLLNFQAYKYADQLPERELTTIQLKKLKRILVHAGGTVPYWRQKFSQLGFQPDRFSGFDDLRRIPITTRAQLKESPIKVFLSSVMPARRGIPTLTSGSTGEPLVFFQDTAKELPRRRAVLLLSMHYAGIKRKTPLLTIGMGDYHQLRGFAVNLGSAADLESAVFRKETLYPFFTLYQPNTIQSSASNIRRLAFHFQQDGFCLPFHGVVTMGESLTDEERDELTQFFRCPITDSYGTRECHPIGIRCGAGNYHLVPWMNYVEIVDDNGSTCPRDEEGNIVVTNFGNEVMPFIRYQIGDRGLILQQPCICGRKSKLIIFKGRIPSYVRLSGGELITVRFFEHILTTYHSGIKKFQIEQLHPDSFLIRYIAIPGRNFSKQMAETKLKNVIRSNAKIDRDIQIVFERVDAILSNAQGKTPLFVFKRERITNIVHVSK